MNDPPSMQQAPAYRKGKLDVEATTELFHRHGPALFAYLRQHTVSREDAEDLLHEVFAAAMEKPQFDLLSNASNDQLLDAL